MNSKKTLNPWHWFVLISFLSPLMVWGDFINEKAITVHVVSSEEVKTTKKIIDRANGFREICIELQNVGRSPVSIKTVDVSIPIDVEFSKETPVIYGNSQMGTPHLFRTSVEDQSPLASSFMYNMIQTSSHDYLFIGSLSWRVFLPSFTIWKNAFHIHSEGEGKQIRPGEILKYESIVLKRSDQWKNLLLDYGKLIANENKIENTKKVDFKGWATWDYYGRTFRKEDVLNNLKQIKQLFPAANILQIDGGWWTERGDFTSVRPDLTGGIQALADQIKSAGMIAGLHFDGFRGDLDSEICKTHPEYFLHDENGDLIVNRTQKAERKLQHVYFDYSHPGAREHIARCVQEMRKWGIVYFKVDFMWYGLELGIKKVNPQVKKIVAHDPSLTSVERFRLGLGAIREASGKENYLLGCSAVFGPAIGFVDGMRTGGDINPRYEAFQERCLANSGNFYLNGSVFNVDCDYLVFREAVDEDQNVSKDSHKSGGSMAYHEAQMWANYVKLFGNARIQSDNLQLLRKERKDLSLEVLNAPMMEESMPVDLWKHARDKSDAFELILARSGKEIYLGVFNWGPSPKSFPLIPLELTGPVRLAGHHSEIIKYKGKKTFSQLFDELEKEH